MNPNNSLKEKLYECDQHILRIIAAKKYLKHTMPLSTSDYEKFDDVLISFADQLVFRFSKLQDTLGERVLPAILILSKEDVKRKTFIDILNRLEELEIINKTQWLNLREVRNQIAHEYSFNTTEVVENITDIFNSSDELLVVYQTVKQFCLKKFKIYNNENQQ
ncbi:MAG: hypothetical protein HFP81_10255 [Methylococcales symbiont of Hymedesmia sp. n. MRB-2018]|nr:MAG: hypothetical protein HFP78_04060 [Methylococcales symbiont of Hymedesmia sp. n. MRB-2018]KAF3982724.1 MAG: hypothetical protein HFP81_10255 [Methylococcales symbiont of Hymedesmia sp. n. MRB-2018]